MAMTPLQTGAIVAALNAQLEAVQASLDAARAVVATLSMDAEDALNLEIDPTQIKVGSDDPATCEHPDDDQIKVLDQRLCGSCGANLTP